MTQGGRGEMRPEIQSAGQNDSLAEAVSVPCTLYNKATSASSWEAENIAWSLCFNEIQFDTEDGLKWKS